MRSTVLCRISLTGWGNRDNHIISSVTLSQTSELRYLVIIRAQINWVRLDVKLELPMRKTRGVLAAQRQLLIPR